MQNDTRLTIQTAPSIAVFETKEIEDAIRAALPGGNNLSTDQVRAAAIAAKTSDLNPFMRELYVTNTGVMRAASVGVASANEWLARNGDQAEWDYKALGGMNEAELREQLVALGHPFDTPDPLSAVCNALGVNISTDTVVLAKLFLRKSQEQWRKSVELAIFLGASKEEIRREYGIRPKPDYTAWGIVRFNEQKDDSPGRDGRKGKTAADKWAEMDAKFGRLERAKKRGRSACINGLLPVTTEQRRRMRFDRGADLVSPIDRPMAPTEEPFGPTWDIVDGSAVETEPAAPEPVASAPPTDVIDAEPEDAPPSHDGPWQPPESERPRDVHVPTRLANVAARISARALFYQERGWTNTEGQDKLTIAVLSKLTNRDDALRGTVLVVLTGFEHWGDVPPAHRKALLKDWLKYENNQVCEEAEADVEVAKVYHRQKTGQGALIS